ncbi:glutathione synthase [Sphingomonas montanisoli]|uniref:Glutathione synthetase n=1 Tax=Sphingomonas montanisoli TaxID=2606412 RepID=A0A5D9CA73_9SPHN|nr:glutathione synthase [Sphingomonas montanisoli]TZG28674.1 glutathione synthase [Sphingomonas montanisoli]
MSLNVAVQMDPLETINIMGDSTFAVMLSGIARGHSLWHYAAGDLCYRDGRLTAPARRITRLARVLGDHFELGEWEVIDLADDIDVVLMRQDPPFDLAYITATHLLERIQHKTLVVNDPASVRNAPEKLFVLDYARFMPPTMITRRLEDARAFHEEHGEVVVKPLYGNAGSAVFHVGRNDANLAALTELFGQVWREPFMVQAFLPDVTKGDKRIVLVDGKVAGAINRLPKKGEIRSNLAAGGKADATELTPREVEICEALGPDLAARGLLFVGIDVIAGHLTEINVTSPTGIVAIDNFNGTDTPALIWEAIEAKAR